MQQQTEELLPRAQERLEVVETRAVYGGIAGLTATVPMTAAMKAFQLALRADERLPSAQEPLLIVDHLLGRLGLAQELSRSQVRCLAWCAHFGYGTACGIGYARFRRRSPLPAPVDGAIYGLVLWALSYGGWLPAFGILPFPTRRRLGRNALLVASHLVWGASAGLAYERYDPMDKEFNRIAKRVARAAGL